MTLIDARQAVIEHDTVARDHPGFFSFRSTPMLQRTLPLQEETQ